MTGNLLPAASGNDLPDAYDRATVRGLGQLAALPSATPAENAWFATVVRHYEGPLTLYVARFVGDVERARDIVQDAFLKLLAEDRKGNREGIESHLAEWLYTVCRNRAVDVRRKEGRVTSLGENAVESFRQTEPSPGPSARVEAQDDAARAMQMLDGLPANQQEVIRLKFQHGLSYKEISAVTSLSVTNVGFLIHTGISALRRQMKR